MINLNKIELTDLLKSDVSAFNAYREKYPEQEINFNRANFEGADLRGAYLEDADFIGANLYQVNFLDVNLKGAYFEI